MNTAFNIYLICDILVPKHIALAYLPLPAQPLKTTLAAKVATSTPEAIMNLNLLASPPSSTRFLV
jgi:hypothetical protein